MKRQFLIFILALAALLGSVAAAWATTLERNFEMRGYVDPTLNPDLPYRVPRLGVNADLSQYTRDELERQLTLMDGAHMTWVRQIFPWDAIEPQRGTFAWDKWDTVVHALDRHPGLRLVAVLFQTPTWARTPEAAGDVNTAPPGDPADFAAFARAFAARYGQSIDQYQIWDEPNLTAAWGYLEPRAASYLALLRAAYAAIHSADDGAEVIAAALAPTVETGPKNISDILFLHDLYALGAKDYMDAVAGKPYGFDAPPLDRTVDTRTLNFSRIVALREEMVSNGDGAKPLWASNWGWNSLPDDWTGSLSIWGSVTADQQTAYTLQALDRADREWPWMAGMILQNWQPNAAANDPLWGFSIINQQGNPTPLWIALSQRPQQADAENGLFWPANPHARYSGVWTFGKLGADIGWVQDSQLDFNFAGRSLALLLRQDNYVAYLYPTVDGQQANAAPHDASGKAYIILTSGSLQPELQLVPVASDLSPGTHTLHITADRGWDHWALAGYAVSAGNLAEPYDRQIALSWLTTAVAAVAVVVMGWQIQWTSFLQPVSGLWKGLSDAGQLAISAVTSIALLIGMLLTWSDTTPNLFRREPVQLALAIVTAGLVYIQPGFLLTLLAVIALFVIFYHRLELALILTIFYAPFFLFPVELYHFAFPMSELLILIALPAWLIRALAAWGRLRQSTVAPYNGLNLSERVRRLSRLDWAVIAWVALGVLSLTWSAFQREAITELRVMIVEPALFYVMLRTVHPDKRTIIRLVDALLLAGFAVAVVGLWLFVRGSAIITAEEGAQRLASVYGSPNNVGLFLGRCIPFALAFLLVKTDRTRRLAAGVALVVMGVAVVLSQSAGAIFIGLPLSIAAVFLLVWGKRALLPLAALAGAVVIAFEAATHLPRFARFLNPSDGTNLFRIRVWESAVNIIRDHPLTGLGLDQFLYAFRGHYIMPDAWQEPNLSHPHNILLDFWVRLGILGVALLIYVQLAFWAAARRVYLFYRNRDPLYFAISVGVIGSMVNLLAHGMVDNSVYVQDLCYVFVLLLGLMAVLSNASAIDENSQKMV